MRSLPSAMPALITPFTGSGELDLRAHRHNVARMWDLGLRGTLIAGSTGEGPYLEPGERRSLVAAAREVAPRSFLLCGIHAETIRSAVAAMHEAYESDADAVLVVTPATLIRHRPDLIEAFFVEVTEAAPLPLLLYSVPKVTGVELAESSVAALSSHPRIVGMKDSGGDPIRSSRLVRAAPDGFKLYAGATTALSLSVAGGAHGAITASANYAPRLVRDTVIAARRSLRAAEPLQTRLSILSTAIESHGIPAVKYAAGRAGFASGHSRAPLASPPAEVKRVVRRSMATAEIG
ncbi:MAG: dihydrodipicolinate synthase family protein [Acidimicrobiia bacterium]